ncbi:hypothetical protein GOBAR_DD00075 [Gossypium barbadense]|nr:hypothetical protein GOBAR_DD00075 [Gossypium barbadense]
MAPVKLLCDKLVLEFHSNSPIQVGLSLCTEASWKRCAWAWRGGAAHAGSDSVALFIPRSLQAWPYDVVARLGGVVVHAREGPDLPAAQIVPETLGFLDVSSKWATSSWARVWVTVIGPFGFRIVGLSGV